MAEGIWAHLTSPKAGPHTLVPSPHVLVPSPYILVSSRQTRAHGLYTFAPKPKYPRPKVRDDFSAMGLPSGTGADRRQPPRMDVDAAGVTLSFRLQHQVSL